MFLGEIAPEFNDPRSRQKKGGALQIWGIIYTYARWHARPKTDFQTPPPNIFDISANTFQLLPTDYQSVR